MDVYKCIACGEEKQSDTPCSCSICGFTMYKTPYDRKDLIISEIRRYIYSYSTDPIKMNELEFRGLNEALTRFPSYSEISRFVHDAEKTEVFIDRLNRSCDQLNEYVHKSYENSFVADLDKAEDHIIDNKLTLDGFFDVLGKRYEVKDIELPKVVMHYVVTPFDERVRKADELFELQKQVIAKLWKFIKQNNLFGEKSFASKKIMKLGKDPQWDELYSKCRQELERVLEKRYMVDIFDDGTAEIGEMLGAVMSAVNVIISSDILRSSKEYIFNGEKWLGQDECEQRISECLNSIFADAREVADSEDFLKEESEDKLFDIYNEMLEMDPKMYMKLYKGKLFVGRAERKLNELIGLDVIKNNIQKIKAYALANKNDENFNLHMCFYGNPGTGKTEVARIIAGILHENGLLPADKVIETDRSGLVGRYMGETPQKTLEVIAAAMGGVLFIDEAYSLVPDDNGQDYGHEAVATLIKAMEDFRGKFCVILAGYKNKLNEMIKTNPGFRSRIQFELDFPNYSREELGRIAKMMFRNRKYSISDPAMDKVLDITDVRRKDPNFANAREIRNIIDQVVMNNSLRCIGSEERHVEIVDVNKYIKDSGIGLPLTGDKVNKRILTADEELDALVGLDAVKRMVKKIKAYGKRNKDSADFNMHMCFYGNPGTGKTEVARILSRLLYDAGVLPEAKLTETDAHGLIGKYVGSTAPKTLEKINDAMGGVLFIDEAYALTNDSKSAEYGDEAISVLLKEMEDKRGKFCVIMAGYKDEMAEMISTNPGLASRIQFTLDFEDYTREELGEIAVRMLESKGYVIRDDALKLVLDLTDHFRKQDNFANARTVRNILDQVIMNQNLRTEDEGGNDIILSDVQDYITDEKIDLSKNQTKKIGF